MSLREQAKCRIIGWIIQINLNHADHLSMPILVCGLLGKQAVVQLEERMGLAINCDLRYQLTAVFCQDRVVEINQAAITGAGIRQVFQIGHKLRSNKQMVVDAP